MDVPLPILERLRKIQALAQSGQTHEAATAQAHLDRLLQTHGVTLEQLGSVERHDVAIAYRGNRDGRLVVHLVRAVTRIARHPVFGIRGRPRVLLTSLSPSEHVDLLEMLAYYRRVFEQEVERLFSAFIHRHRLYVVDPAAAPERPLTPAEQAEAQATARLMQGLSAPSFAKPTARIAHAS
jgi:superfamily I DNA/RNA helicase